MSVLKIVGAIIIAVSGMVGSYALNMSARRSLEQVEGFIALIRRLRTDIECFAMPLPVFLERCGRGTLAKCGYLRESAPRSISELAEGCEVRDGDGARIFAAFGKSIGRGFKSEQLAVCDYYLDMLEARRRSLSEALPARTRTNSALCLCGALALVILLV